MTKTGSFVADVQALRKRAREHMEAGAVTSNYEGDVATTIKILNEALATELVCVLRYKFHAVTAVGIDSEAEKQEFAEHARDEAEQADTSSERMNHLGGNPNQGNQYLPRIRSLTGRISKQVVHQPVAIVSTNSSGSFSCLISRARRG